QRSHGSLDGFFRFVGLGLEFLLQQKVEFIRLNRPRRRLCFLLGFWVSHNCSPLGGSRLRRRFVLWLFRGRKRLQEGGILQQFAHELLRPALAVHIGDEI